MTVRFGHSFILCNDQLHGISDWNVVEDTGRTRNPDSRKSVARMASKVISRNIRPHSKKLYLV